VRQRRTEDLFALKVTPAMSAGVTDRLWEMSDVVDLLEAFEASQKRAA
jgi:hypothetical protein